MGAPVHVHRAHAAPALVAHLEAAPPRVHRADFTLEHDAAGARVIGVGEDVVQLRASGGRQQRGRENERLRGSTRHVPHLGLRVGSDPFAFLFPSRSGRGNRDAGRKRAELRQVVYRRREYALGALERGDLVRVYVEVDRRGEAWADRVDVRESVNERRRDRY